ncbi:unnamed protein product [Microthlaspi erraticum]|uniref:Uncharacterized protein n=1 Tax=Microthlaspi erraticum TaxID=1685480 RepID=A0A6D2K4X4_9BRAS|nr:unnamed protein product [Microthlaspi erraticum]
MDFIKTSSLRALIELTFQRNWNGFIWMSRKGVIAKRVKTAPDGHIENQRPNAQTGWPRNDVPRSAKTVSVRLSLGQSPIPIGRSRVTTRETSPRSAKPQPPRHNRARPKRASRESLAAAQLPHVPARTLRPTRGTMPRVRPRPSANSIRPTAGRPLHHPATTVPTQPKTRPSRPTVRTPRSTRSRF